MCVKVDGKVRIPLRHVPLISDKIVFVRDDIWKFGNISFRVVENTDCEFPKVIFLQNMRLYQNIKNVMESNGLWSNELDAEIPKVWDKFGSVIIFDKDKYFKSSLWDVVGPELWSVVCDTMNVTTIALKGRIRQDGKRSPEIRVVWGDDHWASLKDNNISFTWDITKMMFSTGNVTERHRMANIPCEGEIIVDLFCGIGYFTLPVLVHGKARLVYASDWNPDAITALRRNLITNNVFERCEIHEGDSREFEITDKADRVILGLLPSSKCGWEKACEALKPSGGILHIHENVTYGFQNGKSSLCQICEKLIETAGIDIEASDNRSFSVIDGVAFIEEKEIKYKGWERKLWALHVLHTIGEILKKVKCSHMCWKTEILQLTRVKSYAPHVDHMVLDIMCKVT